MSSRKVVTLEDLLKEVRKYLKNEDDIEKIIFSYNYAKTMHEGQFRKTGEEYINHPLNVALILTTIYADCDSICACLLHDCLEDTSSTKEEIKEKFGPTVLRLVDGVTKINSINVSTENEYLTSYYKKIIVGMSEDVRVIIIKLADRLHNMRTLYAIDIEKQKLKAKETLEILAPIAHRLGMHKIKSELEDLSLKYLKPEVYFDIVEKLNNKKLEREEYVHQMMNEVSNLLKQNGIKHEIKGRAKSIYSIYKKLDKGKKWSDIYDLLAMRILVEKEQECYLALGLIHSKYKPVSKRFKDYIAMPKTNLYQSLHTTVFGLSGNLFEIQIRTYDMDETCENGIASHWAYKENKNASVEMQNVTEQKLQFYKSIIELNEEKMTNEEFVNSVKEEVLNNSIYVYTPKGDVIELIKDATPIDFAYRVHSEVGDHMSGAIVNDVMVPLSHTLKNGDIVKIVTNKSSNGPSREWINIAKSTQAKSKIKNFFNKTSREDYINSGKEQLETTLRRNKLSINEFLSKEHIEEILESNKLDNLDELYLNIGNGKISAKALVKVKEQEEQQEHIKEIKDSNNSSDIIVGDTLNIMTHIANCCMPLPGDDIIGFITKGNGISIHRKSCLNVSNDDERIIEAKWNKKIKNKYNSLLMIYTNTCDNIMFDIVQSASLVNVLTDSINIVSKGDNSVYSLEVIVVDKKEIDKLISQLMKINRVVRVERVMQ